ncbi:MAG: hypothetical protein FJ280_12345, partial [Planctomycetes bacterium]|nr:hypothetical protein [Planctomycetota bacterium]
MKRLLLSKQTSPLMKSILAFLCLSIAHLHAQAAGPLRVHPTNPRYFTDGTKSADGTFRAVYLTGSHTWDIFQRWAEGHIDGKNRMGRPADFTAYLDELQSHGHNFIRDGYRESSCPSIGRWW